MGALGAGIQLRARLWLVTVQLMPNWSAKVEYLHADLGNGPTFTDIFADGSAAVQNVDFNTDIVRLGVNYPFFTLRAESRRGN